MLNKIICVLVASSLFFAASLTAQSVPSATRGALSLSAGAEGSNFNPDWGCANSSIFSCGNNHLWGVAAVVDLDHVKAGFGAEGEARWLRWGGPPGKLLDSNYLIGPRYPVYRHRRFDAYVKFLMGGSWTTLPFGVGAGSYFTIAPGGTMEYGITKKLVVRAPTPHYNLIAEITALHLKGSTDVSNTAGTR